MHPKAEPLQLDGTVYHLFYDLGAMAALKRDDGINLFQLDDDDLTDPDLLLHVLTAGLRKFHPDMTTDTLGGLVGPGDLVAAVQAFSNAWAKALGHEVDLPADPPVSRANRGTGTPPSDSPTVSSDFDLASSTG